MAGDWLKIEANTPDKPEVIGIADMLGISPPHAFGCLFMVWRWFDQHTTSGNAKNVTSAFIDRLTGVPGFAESMCKVEWLIETSSGLQLPNFENHNGNSAKRRAETAVRVAKHKSKKATERDISEAVNRDLIPRPIKRSVMDRDRSTCVYCGRKEGEYAPPETSRDSTIHIDHVIPVSQGGSCDISNLACACSACNLFKSDRTPDQCGLPWPKDKNGNLLGNAKNVTSALPREEKRREEVNLKPHSEERGEVNGTTAAQNPPPPPTRKGIVCGLLRKAGMSDAAPHYLPEDAWEAILAKRTDEEIIDLARAKMAANPGRRIGLKYIAPALLEDPQRIEANARDSPAGRRKTLTELRTETIAGLTGGRTTTPKEQQRESIESTAVRISG